MKRLIYLAVAILCIAGCSKSGGSDVRPDDIYGQWMLTDIGEAQPVVKSTSDITVYLEFTESGTFSLYQKLQEGRYSFYTGTFSLTENILSGTYSSGSAWGSTYEVSLNGDSMVLKALNGSEEETTYTRSTIPDELLSEGQQ